MIIDGIGLSGHDDHTDKETADLRMLAAANEAGRVGHVPTDTVARASTALNVTRLERTAMTSPSRSPTPDRPAPHRCSRAR